MKILPEAFLARFCCITDQCSASCSAGSSQSIPIADLLLSSKARALPMDSKLNTEPVFGRGFLPPLLPFFSIDRRFSS